MKKFVKKINKIRNIEIEITAALSPETIIKSKDIKSMKKKSFFSLKNIIKHNVKGNILTTYDPIICSSKKKLENLFPIKYLDMNSNSKTCKKNPTSKNNIEIFKEFKKNFKNFLSQSIKYCTNNIKNANLNSFRELKK